ncbi:unnamed protein product [Calypogeia fissa]
MGLQRQHSLESSGSETSIRSYSFPGSMGFPRQHSSSVLKDNLFQLREVDPEKDQEVIQEIISSILNEIENSECIDLHYTGHARELTVGDPQLLLLIAVMKEVDLSRLQVLNLSGCVFENEKIITMMADLLTFGNLPVLRYLDVSGHYTLTDGGNAAIARALKSGRLANLEHLGLPRCNIGDMVDAIQEGTITELKGLTLTGRDPIEEPTPSDVHRLFEAGHMTQIKKLVMKGHTLDSIGTVGLTRALHCNPAINLQTLDLSSNTIGVSGSIALARLVEDGNLVLLRNWRFSSCGIDGEQMETIMQGLESGLLCNLEHLDVSWNKFKDQGALALARVIEAGHLPELRRLNLGYCEIGTEFKLRHGILAVLEALGEGNMSQLEWLNLLGNQIGHCAATTMANTIVEILEMMPKLRFVNLFDSRRGNHALKQALDLVLRYPVSEFTAVYSGLKRKTRISLYGPNGTSLRQKTCNSESEFHGEGGLQSSELT